MRAVSRVCLIAALLCGVLDVAGGSGPLESPYGRVCGGAWASARGAGAGAGAGDGGEVRNSEVICRNSGAASLPRLRGGGLPGFHSWINNMNGHDDYFGQAKASGYRARSAYKLLDLDREHGILKGAKKVVDLAAAPGSWSQVIAERQRQDAPDFPQAEENMVVAVDLQPMRPIKGVKQLQGDITSPEVADKIRSMVGEGGADLVVCDGAPDITGLHDLDEWCASSLVQSALELASTLLKKGGSFVCKVMIVDASRPTQETLLYSQLRALFGEVCFTKPPSSRSSSHEHFLVCSKFLKTSTNGSALNGLLKCGTLQGVGGVDESIQGMRIEEGDEEAAGGKGRSEEEEEEEEEVEEEEREEGGQGGVDVSNGATEVGDLSSGDVSYDEKEGMIDMCKVDDG